VSGVKNCGVPRLLARRRRELIGEAQRVEGIVVPAAGVGAFLGNAQLVHDEVHACPVGEERAVRVCSGMAAW
jgi:hypothetical protein